MGWKGYEMKIPAGMIFRKMYCCKCGTLLEKQKQSTVYKKGEVGYQNKILGHSTIGMDKKEEVSYVYKCPNCQEIVSYDEQVAISKIQKKMNKKILTEHKESHYM